MSIRTVLFDLDGTLIDTNELIVQSFLHTLNHFFPDQYKREDVLDFMGPPLDESFQQVLPDKVEEMIQVYRDHNLYHHDSFVVPFEGVKETIHKLKDQGIKVGIVTTKIKSTAVRGLVVTELQEYFDVVIGYDDVTHAKPHPEPIIKGLEALDAKASEALMVGDNYHDILAGQNAGVKTAGVAWSIKGKEALAKYKPDYMLEKISDLLDIVGK
jgi:pyrophosphatase PpaX